MGFFSSINPILRRLLSPNSKWLSPHMANGSKVGQRWSKLKKLNISDLEPNYKKNLSIPCFSIDLESLTFVLVLRFGCSSNPTLRKTKQNHFAWLVTFTNRVWTKKPSRLSAFNPSKIFLNSSEVGQVSKIDTSLSRLI